MKAIHCWASRLVNQMLKTKASKLVKSRHVISLESLSYQMRGDIGLDNGSDDAADYTKYL